MKEQDIRRAARRLSAVCDDDEPRCRSVLSRPGPGTCVAAASLAYQAVLGANGLRPSPSQPNSEGRVLMTGRQAGVWLAAQGASRGLRGRKLAQAPAQPVRAHQQHCLGRGRGGATGRGGLRPGRAQAAALQPGHLHAHAFRGCQPALGGCGLTALCAATLQWQDELHVANVSGKPVCVRAGLSCCCHWRLTLQVKSMLCVDHERKQAFEARPVQWQ